jgi:leucyl/phenylalanyl-tRNA--protein transferase
VFVDFNPGEFEFSEEYLDLESDIVQIGGDLSTGRILSAYSKGIFPWYSYGPVVWWSPDPRFVLYPADLKISKSMRNLFNQKRFEVTFDQNFSKVIDLCAHVDRVDQDGTWITKEMDIAYNKLHEMGYAHSVEVWNDGQLVGGLYGIALGKIFFGESMFTLMSNASKYGFITLVKFLIENDFFLIDCQQNTAHLGSLGAVEIERSLFLRYIDLNNQNLFVGSKWSF